MGERLGLPVLAAGALVSAGAAVLPDIDHPGSSASRTFGPASQLTALGIGTLAGGHRQRTHSLAFVAAIGCASALAGATGPWGAGVTVGVAAALAVRLIGPQSWRGVLGPLMVAVAVGWAVATAVPAGPWLAAAVVLGSLTHLLGDAITPGRAVAVATAASPRPSGAAQRRPGRDRGEPRVLDAHRVEDLPAPRARRTDCRLRLDRRRGWSTRPGEAALTSDLEATCGEIRLSGGRRRCSKAALVVVGLALASGWRLR